MKLRESDAARFISSLCERDHVLLIVHPGKNGADLTAVEPEVDHKMARRDGLRGPRLVHHTQTETGLLKRSYSSYSQM